MASIMTKVTNWAPWCTFIWGGEKRRVENEGRIAEVRDARALTHNEINFYWATHTLFAHVDMQSPRTNNSLYPPYPSLETTKMINYKTRAPRSYSGAKGKQTKHTRNIFTVAKREKKRNKLGPKKTHRTSEEL